MSVRASHPPYSTAAQHCWLLLCPLVVFFALASARYQRSGAAAERPANVAAQVGSTFIMKADLAVAEADVAVDLQPHLSAPVRREVLDKLIKEELIYQYGVAHHISETDPYVRFAIVRAMLTLACNPASSASAISLQQPGDMLAGGRANDCPALSSPEYARGVDRYVNWLRSRAKIVAAAGPP